jgi:hypothetical protein
MRCLTREPTLPAAWSGNLIRDYAELKKRVDTVMVDNEDAIAAGFGPNVGDFFAWYNQGGWYKWGKKGSFDWLNDGKRKANIRCAAYGLYEAAVVIFTDGYCQWIRLDQSYPDLLTLLKKQRQGDVIVSDRCSRECVPVPRLTEIQVRSPQPVPRQRVLRRPRERRGPHPRLGRG